MGVLEAFRVLRGMLHRAATMKLLVGLAGGLGLGGHAQAACNPVMIVDQPWSMTVLENCQAVFHVSVSGSAPYTFQWLKNGDAIADATNSSYATPPANLADNGTVYDVIVSNACGQLISSNAILTISPDTVPPRLLSAVGGPTLNQVVLSFAVGACPGPGATLEYFSATDTANYVVDEGLEVASAELSPSGTNVILTTARQTEGVSYTITVNNVTDLEGNIVSPNSRATFRAWVTSRGFLFFDSKFLNPSSDIITDPCVLNCTCGSVRARDQLYLTAFDSRTVYPDDSHENYCARITGFFIPPDSGNWIFYLRSDDSSKLWLNPQGEDPAGAVLLTEENGCCRPFSAHASAPQELVAGQKYYVEAIYHEGFGGDYLQVAAQLATNASDPDSLPPIPGAWLATRADPTGATIEITQQPSNVDAAIGASVTFALGARGSIAGNDRPPIFYQWQRLDPQQASWRDIAGANQRAYTTTFLSCQESGTQFRCRVAVPGASTLSQAASTYVFGDDTYPVRLLQQPQSQTVVPGCPATFSVTAVGSIGFPPVGPSYQWFRDGIAIPGATNSSYTPSLVTVIDNGSRFYVVVSNYCGAVPSSEAILTVILDTFPPTLVGAAPGPTPDKVVLSFATECPALHGGLDPSTAMDIFNYTLSGGLVVSNAELSCSGVVLTTSRQTDGAAYTVTVNDISDSSGNVIKPNSQATFQANARVRGLLRREVYGNISGNTLSDLTNHVSFPYCPAETRLVTSFEAPRNVGDLYGQRFSGLVLAPVTGNYTFWIASDDESALFLSTDDTPANKRLIASVQTQTFPRSWVCPSLPGCSNVSSPITLEAARFYYVEAQMKEGTGGDHLAVAWQMPGGAPPRQGQDVIPGSYLATYAAPATQLTITQQPQSVMAAQGCKATFTVGAAVQPAGTPVTYQWQRNSQDIPGANSPVYVTGYLTPSDNLTVYRCLVRAPGINRTSANAFLTLSPDVRPPVLTGAGCYSPTTVLLFFSEPVLLGPAANFTLSGERLVSFSRAELTNRLVVELDVSTETPLTPGARYSVTVTGVTDASGNPLSPEPATADFKAQSALAATPAWLIRLTPAGRQTLVEWPGDGVLQAADDLGGPWQDLPDAFSPYVEGGATSPCASAGPGSRRFYRLRLGSF